MKTKVPKLPQLLDRKIYKTGQTRGADDDVIFQNRVGRNSTVLIPYQFWNESFSYPENERNFENGFIVLIPPAVYFKDKDFSNILKKKVLKIDDCIGPKVFARIQALKEGEILISPMTIPDFVLAMKKAAAIVTDEGGVLCHAAIVARELEKPTVVGTEIATKRLQDSDIVEVNATEGKITLICHAAIVANKLKKPCIVGTKIATQIFKDGDLVEVDADRGIVRKI